MDNSATSVRFAPDLRFTAAAGVGVVVLAILALVADDGPSRLIFWVGVVVLVAFVVSDLGYRPRLEVSADGIAIRSPLLRTSLDWSRIESVHADARLRLGLRSTTLEVDAGEVLAVFSRRSIGTDPDEAARLIAAFRPPSGSAERGAPYRDHDDDQY